jgi:hypothetical protein
VLDHKDAGQGPKGPRDNGDSAAVLINALPKRDFAPVALPLLKPEVSWHGYDLGVWPKNIERQAAMAARSEYFDFENELVLGRRKDVAMNDPVPRHNDD